MPEESTKTSEKVESKPVSDGGRDLTFAGVVLVLLIALTAGVVTSAGWNLISGIATGGVRWKMFSLNGIDTAYSGPADQSKVFTFGKVDLKELDESIHLVQAKDAFLKMDYGRGLTEVQAVSDARRSQPDARTIEVECLLALKQSDKVMEIANSNIEKSPDDYAGWLWRGEAYEQTKQYPKAIADYQKCLSTLVVTREQLAKKMPPALLEHMERIMSGIVYRRLGASFERSGDFKQAAINYEQSVRKMTANLSSTLFTKPDKSSIVSAQRTVTESTGALSQNPDDSGLYLMRAKAYKILGKHDLALKDYANVKNSDTANYHYERAGAYFGSGDFKKAAFELRKTHAEDPLYDQPHMRQRRLSADGMPGPSLKSGAALASLDDAVNDNPTVAENFFHRGVFEVGLREYASARRDLQHYLSMDGEKSSVEKTKAQIFQALAHGLSKQTTECDLALRRAYSSCESKWWQAVISCLRDIDVTETALLNAAKDDKARSVQAHYYIGQKLAIKGMKTKAIEHFKAGIALGAPVDEYYLCKMALLPETRSESEQ